VRDKRKLGGEGGEDWYSTYSPTAFHLRPSPETPAEKTKKVPRERPAGPPGKSGPWSGPRHVPECKAVNAGIPRGALRSTADLSPSSCSSSLRRFSTSSGQLPHRSNHASSSRSFWRDCPRPVQSPPPSSPPRLQESRNSFCERCWRSLSSLKAIKISSLTPSKRIVCACEGTNALTASTSGRYSGLTCRKNLRLRLPLPLLHPLPPR